MIRNFAVSARILSIALIAVFAAGCANLHHVQIGDLDNSQGTLTRFDVKASATGLNVSEATNIAKGMSRNKEFHQANNALSNVWEAITYGPRTGEVTFTTEYADQLPKEILAACPHQQITGVTAIRETNKYPVISGEIVRFVGYCLNPKLIRGTLQ